VSFVFDHRPANPESPIPNPVTQFVFYGGKGGVGKTTCAAARALTDAARGARVFIVSTDPAHSLGDALGVPLSSTPRPIAMPPRAGTRARGRLHGVELDAPRAFRRWVASHRQGLGEIVEHGTWLDHDDADALLNLPIPGVDELVGLVEIMRMAASAAYDVVIVDTAPTGHTLRLLAAPATVASVADILDALQAEHRAMREQFARRGRPEAADRLIALIAGEARETGERLRDRERTAFEWVMLPEALSLAESADGVAALDRARIPVRDVIVNRVIPDGPPCPICDRRRAAERRVIARIPRVLGRTRRVRVLAAQTREPRGVQALAALGRAFLSRHGCAQAAAMRRAAAGRSANLSAGALAEVEAVALHSSVSGPVHRRKIAPEDLPALTGASLLFFAGKGGVGKTTVAAATAVRLARADPARRVLLLSTDPAHSLADVFGTAVGDQAAPVRKGPANLHVRELDAAAALAVRRGEFEAAIGEIAETFGNLAPAGNGGAEQAIGQLLDLAPPGIDELFGMLTVVDAQRDYPLIVIDTAPTGHALRLLEMPEAAREWVQALLRVLLKYRSIARPQRLAESLVDLSKSVRALQDRLRDPEQTRFVVVTRAADLPRRETERLLSRLRRLHLAVPAVVLNARTMAPGNCPRCRAVSAEERTQAAALRARCGRTGGRCVIIETPLAAPPPRGIAALDRFARAWTLDV
jgi:arsenite/tail-anchored protein-transporting ATPase